MLLFPHYCVVRGHTSRIIIKHHAAIHILKAAFVHSAHTLKIAAPSIKFWLRLGAPIAPSGTNHRSAPPNGTPKPPFHRSQNTLNPPPKPGQPPPAFILPKISKSRPRPPGTPLAIPYPLRAPRTRLAPGRAPCTRHRRDTDTHKIAGLKLINMKYHMLK